MSVQNPIDTLAHPLALDQIQGNVIAGFNKDHQRFLFLQINNAALAKKWLHTLIPQISTTTQVKAFNDLFRAERLALGVDPPTSLLSATWTNIAFTATGIAALGVSTTGMPAEFLAGMAARKVIIGDAGASDPAHWQPAFKDPHKLHLLVHVAADEPAQLAIQTSLILAGLVTGGLTLLLDQSGENLTGNMGGFEHFGFKDGISQPGVKTFTKSVNDQPQPDEGHQGVPGQDLLWPGEFVIGYPTQVATPLDQFFKGANPTQGPNSTAGPAWTKDGSFLVFRKLAQDVPGFRANMIAMAAAQGIGADVLGAKLVGRFSSGCPMEPTAHEVDPDQLPALVPQDNGFPDSFDPNNGDPAELHSEMLHPNLINNFEYGPEVPTRPNVPPVQPPAKDPLGNWVARAGHIRKVYPRNEVFLNAAGVPDPALGLNESFTQTKRMLRRGIPYGPQIPLPTAPAQQDAAAAILAAANINAATTANPLMFNPGLVFQGPFGPKPPVERGLLFLAYQKNIADQFEFVQQTWINNADFPQKGDGLDPIMSQHPSGAITCPIKGHLKSFDVKHFVTTAGGEYFFQPSIAALTIFAT